MGIEDLRGKIDEIDAQLIELFLKRMEVSSKIADHKTRQGLSVLDKHREQAIVSRYVAELEPPMDGYVRMLFRSIFNISRAYQTALINENAAAEEE